MDNKRVTVFSYNNTKCDISPLIQWHYIVSLNAKSNQNNASDTSFAPRWDKKMSQMSPREIYDPNY